MSQRTKSLTAAKRELWGAIQHLCNEWAAGDYATREQLTKRKRLVNDAMGRLIAAAARSAKHPGPRAAPPGARATNGSNEEG